MLNVVRERVVSSTGRKATPSVSFQSRSLIADVDDAEDVPVCYVSNSGHPPPRSVRSTKTVRPGEPWNKRSCEHCWSHGYDNDHHKKNCEHHKRLLASQARKAAKASGAGKSSVPTPSAYVAPTPVPPVPAPPPPAGPPVLSQA